MLSLSVNTNNQITNAGFTYDADGDLAGDGTCTYSWNAEQHLSSAANVTYTYDGRRRRVKKSSGTLYWNSPRGVPLAETDSSGNTLNEYIFFGAARIARRDSSGNVYYYFHDMLGTTATLANSSGALCYDADFLPFGYEKTYVTSCAQNYKFTGLERDGETGLDHSLNRKYDSSLGRWLTPDPKRGSALNPQSWNRNAYALDNPAALTDPPGLIEADYPPCTDTGMTDENGNPIFECNSGSSASGGDGGDDTDSDDGDDGSGGEDSGIPVNLGAPPTPPLPPVVFPFTLAKYEQCSQQCFGNSKGNFSVGGAGYNMSYAAAAFIDWASQGTGVSAVTIAGTYLIESGGGSLAPYNNQNTNGSVDIGPMQLNYTPGSTRWPSEALGTNLAGGELFNGNAYWNIYEGAAYLATLANPGNYVGSNPAAVQHRDSSLNALAPDLKKFFNCLLGP
jgi:RHS repeat-associated protein